MTGYSEETNAVSLIASITSYITYMDKKNIYIYIYTIQIYILYSKDGRVQLPRNKAITCKI